MKLSRNWCLSICVSPRSLLRGKRETYCALGTRAWGVRGVHSGYNLRFTVWQFVTFLTWVLSPLIRDKTKLSRLLWKLNIIFIKSVLHARTFGKFFSCSAWRDQDLILFKSVAYTVLFICSRCSKRFFD